MGVYLQINKPVAYKNNQVVQPNSTVSNYTISYSPLINMYTLTFPSCSIKIRAFSSRLDFSVDTPSNDNMPMYSLGNSLSGAWDTYLTFGNGTKQAGQLSQASIDSLIETCMYFITLLSLTN